MRPCLLRLWKKVQSGLRVIKEALLATARTIPLPFYLFLPASLLVFLMAYVIYSYLEIKLTPEQIMCVIVPLSVLTVAKVTGRHSEALLQLFVSMFAVFTIQWTGERARLFFSITGSFTSLLLFIRYNERVDEIFNALVEARSGPSITLVYSRLKKCGIPRHEVAAALRFLRRKGVPFSDLENLFDQIVPLYRGGLSAPEATTVALRLASALAVLQSHFRDSSLTVSLRETILESAIGPADALHLLERTIHLVLTDRMTMTQYTDSFAYCCQIVGVADDLRVCLLSYGLVADSERDSVHLGHVGEGELNL